MVAILSWFAGYSKIDDAYIYARYVRNALAGHGMVFNVGERVNALSSPLYAYLLLFVSWLLHGRVLLSTAVISGVFLVLTCVLAEYLVPLSGLFLASTAYFYFLVGMETSLFVFMLLLVIALFQQGKWSWLPVASILLILSRFEGGLLVLIVGWQLYRRRIWPGWISFIPAILVGLGYLLLNHHYYGGFLPASAAAKLGQGFSGYWGRWPTAFLGHPDSVLYTFQKTKFILYLTAVFCVSGVTVALDRPFGRLVLPFCGGLSVFYVLFNMSGTYFWYFAPLILFAMMLACCAIPRTRVAYVTAGVLLIFALLANAGFLRQPWQGDRYVGYQDVSQWIRANTPVNARVEVAEIGILAWASDRYTLDIIGLVTPKNALHISHHDTRSWLMEDQPDYIVLHDPSWSWERVAMESGSYVELPMKFPGDLRILAKKQ